MKSQYKTGAILSYSSVVFNTVAGLIYTPWMISCIGADDYGLYTLALSVVNFFYWILGSGIRYRDFFQNIMQRRIILRLPSFWG